LAQIARQEFTLREVLGRVLLGVLGVVMRGRGERAPTCRQCTRIVLPRPVPGCPVLAHGCPVPSRTALCRTHDLALLALPPPSSLRGEATSDSRDRDDSHVGKILPRPVGDFLTAHRKGVLLNAARSGEWGRAVATHGGNEAMGEGRRG